MFTVLKTNTLLITFTFRHYMFSFYLADNFGTKGGHRNGLKQQQSQALVKTGTNPYY